MYRRKKYNKQTKYRCDICGRKLTRADLIKTGNQLRPLYEYITSRGELKYMCVRCFHELNGRRIARISRKYLAIREKLVHRH